MPELPPELITDILSRLPVKPLLQFRCVSKPWRSLIDSSHFIKIHLNRSIQTRTNLTLMLRDTVNPHLYSLEFDSLHTALKLNHHPLKSDKNQTQIWGSCNGLLCLSNTQEDLVLWNPSTKKFWKLPTSPIKKYPTYFWVFQSVVFGFGFESKSNDYKVVRIAQFQGVEVEFMDYVVEVYSLNSNSWRRVQNFPHDLAVAREPGLFVSGALHWHVSKNFEEDMDDLGLIIAFDIAEEEYQLVPQPEYKCTNFAKFIFNVGKLEGCLCVICEDYLVGIDIWVMKEYGVKESWTKLITIGHSDVVRSFDDLRPVAYSKEGGKVLLELDAHRFLWYDLERKTIERVKVRGRPDEFETNVCFGSLVALDGGGGDGSYGKKEATQDTRNKNINRRKRRDER